jgi:hypothetical protein
VIIYPRRREIAIAVGKPRLPQAMIFNGTSAVIIQVSTKTGVEDPVLSQEILHSLEVFCKYILQSQPTGMATLPGTSYCTGSGGCWCVEVL